MRKRIANFEEFINEGYLQRIGSKISQWASSFMNAVKRGLVRIIPFGPKKGLPAFMYFSGENGSILDQIEKFYAGTEFSKMNNINDPSTVTEAKVPLQYPVSDDVPDYNVEQIKRDLKRNLKVIVQATDEKTAFTIPGYFIFGAPGIGKTQIVAQVCDELGRELYGKPLDLIPVDGETAEPVDFAGVPKVVDIEGPSEKNPYGKGVTRSNVSVDYFPTDNGTDGHGGIIFIDELNRMPENVIKIFMKLVQSRRIGTNYTIPSKWYIVAAGNRKDDDPKNGLIKELGTAFRERFTFVNYVPTPKAFRKHVETDTWQGYKLSDVVLPELLDFIETENGLWFHTLDPELKRTKFASPRSWIAASFELKRALDELKEEARAKGKELTVVPEEEIVRQFTKHVGKDAAQAFVQYYKVASEIPVKDLILPFTDPEKAPLPGKKGRGRTDYDHALFSAVVRKSKELELTKDEICNFCKWLGLTKAADYVPAALTTFIKINDLKPRLIKEIDIVPCISAIADQYAIDPSQYS